MSALLVEDTADEAARELAAVRERLRRLPGRELVRLLLDEATPTDARAWLWWEVQRRRLRRYAGQPARVAAAGAERPEADPSPLQQRHQRRAAVRLGVDLAPLPRAAPQQPPIVCRDRVRLRTADGVREVSVAVALRLHEDLAVASAALRRLQRPQILRQALTRYAERDPALLAVLGLRREGE